jgi:putative spermidine/putrescine transport system permease protein
MASSSQLKTRTSRPLLGAAAALVYGFLYLPLIVLILYAFNRENVNSWPLAGLSLRWFGVLAQDLEPRTAFVNSLLVALSATVAAVLLGTAAAFALDRFRFPGRGAISFAITLPILLPGIITGIAMVSLFSTVNVSLSLATVAVGHTTFCIVLVMNNVLARLRRTPRSLEEASMDLGADQWMTFWQVTLPSIRSAIVAGALLAFTLSFDEIVVTFFLIGPQNTLPLWILGRIRLGQDFPEVNAAAVVVIAISMPVVLFAQWLVRGEGAELPAV